ncbi:MAG: PIN domain-containing protein [Bifidobacteriaceae bacterium]|nr:PIN domain-containing protein [Bifidobacteriaceae bacterium]
MIPAPRRVFLDTNVFLAAVDLARPEKPHAVRVLKEWPAAGVALYTSTQVMREFLVVATRPTDANGLGLTLADALSNASEFAQVATVLPETLATWRKLLAVLPDSSISGARIHDANIAACALANGISTVVSANTADFESLPVEVMGLGS